MTTRTAASALTFMWVCQLDTPPPVQSRPAVPSSSPTPSSGRRVGYAPGVVIDWPNTRIELTGKVVLREGLLELLACSPRTREHESIMAIDARPLHVFQALGLVGLEPGHPVRYDEEHDRWLAPSGDPIEIQVRWTVEGKTRTVDVWDWLKDAETGAPLEARGWIFCGSRSFPGGTFGADADGTVICVVDFDTALIGLAEMHSADNAELWVAANSEKIPPPGTPCTMLIRRAGTTLPEQPAASQPTASRPTDRGG